MLKIIVTLVFIAPGMTDPQVLHKDVASFEECVSEISKIRAKAEEMNAKGGDAAEFKIMAGCQFSSEKSDPT